ncbi:hypothetical protein ACOSQ2_018738 [Xanthoceras sorbifolium]
MSAPSPKLPSPSKTLSSASSHTAPCSHFCGHTHIRSTNSESNRADSRDIKSGGDILDMDDPTTLCFGNQCLDFEILTGAEQDHGNGRDIGCGVGVARVFLLVADAEAGLGSGWCNSGTKCVVVDDRYLPAFAYI